jgi:hypothetical protein
MSCCVCCCKGIGSVLCCFCSTAEKLAERRMVHREDSRVRKVNKEARTDKSAATEQGRNSLESRSSSINVESSANFRMRSLTFSTNKRSTPWVIFNYGDRICIKKSIGGRRVVYNPILDCSRLDDGSIIAAEPPSDELLRQFEDTVNGLAPSRISHWIDSKGMIIGQPLCYWDGLNF